MATQSDLTLTDTFLDQRVLCPACGWRGLIRGCRLEVAALVKCPYCAKPVQHDARPIKFREWL